MRISSFVLGVAVAFNCLSSSAQAQAIVAEVCNEAGLCAPIDPTTALVIIGIKTVADELKKGSKGFGPNGEIMKAANTVLGDLRRGGLGENNDLVKAWETIKNDLTKGPGENNDIIKALARMNIKL